MVAERTVLAAHGDPTQWKLPNWLRSLVLVSNGKVSERDFREVRPNLDLERCISNASVLLSVDFLKLSDIPKILSKKIPGLKGKPLKDLESTFFSDVQSLSLKESLSGDFDGNNWLIVSCSLPTLSERQVIFVKTTKSLYISDSTPSARLVAIIIASPNEKVTHSGFELAKTLATLLVDTNLRQELVVQETRENFLKSLLAKSRHFARAQLERVDEQEKRDKSIEPQEPQLFSFGTGIVENLKRRTGYYVSDYVDGVVGDKTIHKVLATTFFLYFLCILSSVALGVLNSKNTKGKIDAERALFGQAIGGLVWALVAGQPFVIIATTAPLSLCNKIVFELSESLNVEFYTIYAWVGIWNAAFCGLYGLCGVSSFIRFSTRSIEEIFCMFSVVCFAYGALKDLFRNFDHFYFSEACLFPNGTVGPNGHMRQLGPLGHCHQENSLLFLALMAGTFWLALKIYDFKDSVFLNATTREVLSDYALPISVILFSLLGKFVFHAIPVEHFKVKGMPKVSAAKLGGMSAEAMFLSIGLGFAVSLLFFMDQGISARMVDAPNHKLKKGNAHHIDFVWVALINVVLSIYGLPWMNGLLPHSPLHVRSLADYEETIEDGYVRQVVVRVRETRLSAIFCHILIGISAMVVPVVFSFLPVPVLDGLFLYCAASLLRNNSFADRLGLIFTDQSKYPPTHYVRRCPQRAMHSFTAWETLLFILLTFIGYAPWALLQMMFPLFIALLIPIRWYLLPRFIDSEHLKTLDDYKD